MPPTNPHPTPAPAPQLLTRVDLEGIDASDFVDLGIAAPTAERLVAALEELVSQAD